MKWYHFVLLYLTPLVVAAQPATPDYDFGILDQQIDSILETRKVPGAQLAIVSRDSILWLGNYGYADLEKELPVTNETMFRIGSITKSFVAVAAMMIAVFSGIRSFDREMNGAARIHSFFVGLACLGVTAYLGYWGVLGIRLWVF